MTLNAYISSSPNILVLLVFNKPDTIHLMLFFRHPSIAAAQNEKYFLLGTIRHRLHIRSSVSRLTRKQPVGRKASGNESKIGEMQGFTFSRPSMSLGSNTNMLRSLFLYGIRRIWACKSSRKVKLKEWHCVIIGTDLLVLCNKVTEHAMSKEA